MPFIWKRHEKDDDEKGLEERNRNVTEGQDPAKPTDGDTPMPQVHGTTGPRTSSLGLLDPVISSKLSNVGFSLGNNDIFFAILTKALR